jgi:hypothetical protein
MQTNYSKIRCHSQKVGAFLNARIAHGVGGKAADVFGIFHFSMSVIA